MVISTIRFCDRLTRGSAFRSLVWGILLLIRATGTSSCMKWNSDGDPRTYNNKIQDNTNTYIIVCVHGCACMWVYYNCVFYLGTGFVVMYAQIHIFNYTIVCYPSRKTFTLSLSVPIVSTWESEASVLSSIHRWVNRIRVDQQHALTRWALWSGEVSYSWVSGFDICWAALSSK